MTTERNDRVERVDKSIDRGREGFDESKATGGGAREEGQEAIDDLEARSDNLRNRPEA